MLPSAEFAAFCCENLAALTGFAWGRLVVVSQEEISRSPPQPCSHGKGHHGAGVALVEQQWGHLPPRTGGQHSSVAAVSYPIHAVTRMTALVGFSLAVALC